MNSINFEEKPLIEKNTNNNKKIYGYILSLVGVIILSFDTLLTKFISNHKINNWIFIFIRFSLYFLACFILNLITEKKKIFIEIYNLGFSGLISIIFLSLCNIFFTKSIINSSVAITLSIYSISPIITSLFTWFILKDKIKIWTIISLIGVVATVITIVLQDIKINNNLSNIYGYIFAVIAMVATSGYFTCLKYNNINYPEKKMILTISLSCFITLIVCYLFIFINKINFQVPKEDFKFILIQGLFILPISYICLINSVKYISSVESNLMLLLETGLAPIWLYLFNIEKSSLITIIGLIIILVLLSINSLISIKYDNK